MMLRHVLGRARHDQRDGAAPRLRARAPSTPPTWSSSARARVTRATSTTPKIKRRTRERSTTCSHGEKPFLAVCLGHQVLCGALGLRADLQGHRLPGHADEGRPARSVRRTSASTTRSSRKSSRRTRATTCSSRPTPRPATSTCVAGPDYRGIQFHAESILTENGFDLIRELLLGALRRATDEQTGAGPGRRPLRLVHLQPGPPDRRRDRHAARRGPARRPGGGRRAGATATPTWCCHPGRARCTTSTTSRSVGRSSPRRRSRCSASASGMQGIVERLRRRGRGRRPGARRGLAGPAHRHRRLRRRAAGLQGGALPLAGRRRRARRPRA